MPAYFNILRLQSGALYIGATKDLEKRYEKHFDGSASRTTSLDPHVLLVYSEEHESFSDARKREAQVKRWTRARKEALVASDKDKLRALSKSRENLSRVILLPLILPVVPVENMGPGCFFALYGLGV